MPVSEAMPMTERVRAAQRGDREALQGLVADHLTMLYNVVGRALNGHADVDDVVQETLLRVVESLGTIREPARFSGWILAIAHRQAADRLRRRQQDGTRLGPLEPAAQVADPGADFANATILRLGLSAERRQVVEAVRWLDADDRFVLSLWWLEVAGTISRADLVTALGTTPGHAAVRVKRMRDQLDLARHVAGAVAAPACDELTDVLRGWDGVPGSVWRKRIARHLRDCPVCTAGERRLVPPDALLAGIAMLPVPASLAAAPISLGAATAVSAASAGLLAKVAVAVVAAAAISGGVVAAVHHDSPVADAPQVTAPPVTAPSPSISRSPAAPAHSPAPARTTVRYGSVVDTVDAAPPKNRRPDRLPARPEGTLAVAASADEDPRPDVTSLIRRGQRATYRGRGYVRIEFAVAYTQRVGTVTMPSWTGLRGKLFHVASGGGRRLDDRTPGGGTGMGDATHGYATLPAGAQQMWAFEYYYLDGEVTLTSNERGADYNLYVHVVTRSEIDKDLRTPPATNGPIRYGLTRDEGTDACPVPQYATRTVPAATATVPQRSEL